LFYFDSRVCINTTSSHSKTHLFSFSLGFDFPFISPSPGTSFQNIDYFSSLFFASQISITDIRAGSVIVVLQITADPSASAAARSAFNSTAVALALIAQVRAGSDDEREV
jgi:hypothetical protein